ncbi:Phenylacetate-coenzyme A ligase [compost metagenome]
MGQEHRYLDVATQQVVGQELARNIKTYVGISAKVLVQPGKSLKRSEGKACRVYDRRP